MVLKFYSAECYHCVLTVRRSVLAEQDTHNHARELAHYQAQLQKCKVG